MMRFIVSLLIVTLSLYADFRAFAKKYGYGTNYKTALQKARTLHKPLFVVVIKGGCPYCVKMENEVLNDPDVNSYIHKNFVPLILKRRVSEIPKQLSFPFTPVSFVIDAKSERILRTIIGYMEIEQYLWQF
jgi:thioredoxin-related protein